MSTLQTMKGLQSVFLAPLENRVWIKRLRLAWVVMVVVLATAYHLATGFHWLAYDDAYITLHNAQSLHALHDARFPAHGPLFGCTSPVHTFALALITLVVRGEAGVFVLAWMGVLALVLAVTELAIATRASLVGAVLLVLLALLSAHVPSHLLNGLETGLALAAIAFAFALVCDRSRWHAATLPLVLGTLPFIRPEFIGLSVLLSVDVAVDWYRNRATLSVRRESGVFAKWMLLAAAPWALMLTLATHAPWPNTIRAKHDFFAEGCLLDTWLNRWTHESLSDIARTTSLALIALPMLFASRRGWLFAVFCTAMVLTYRSSFPGAMKHYDHRYLTVLLVGVPLGFSVGFGARREIIRTATTLVAVVTLAMQLRALPQTMREHFALRTFVRDALGSLATWVNQTLPNGSRMLAHDVGYLAWATQVPLIDAVGLKSETAMRLHAVNTWPSCGAGRPIAFLRLAEWEKATHVTVLRAWDEVYEITLSFRTAGWTIEIVRDDPVYRVFRIAPPVVQ